MRRKYNGRTVRAIEWLPSNAKCIKQRQTKNQMGVMKLGCGNNMKTTLSFSRRGLCPTVNLEQAGGCDHLRNSAAVH